MDITQRIDSITKIPVDRLKTIIPAPRSVKIELSPRCNFRCGFCSLSARVVQPKTDMDLNLFKRITKEMLDAGVEEIGVFYIGESTINPDLLEAAILYLKEIGMPYVFLTSNGSLATPAIVERVMKAGLDSLKWSVNACDEAQFATIMAVSPKMFRNTIKNIQEAFKIRNEKGYKTKLSASSIQYDKTQEGKMENFLNENIRPYVDKHYWLPLYSMASFATTREEELGYRPTAGNQGRIGALVDPLPCWSVFTEGHVRADGGLTVCCFDGSGKFQVGDLNKESFMDAWNSDGFQKFRAAHLKKDVTGTACESCIAYAHATKLK
jgi:MoaA/NifB/PqqE/SkfB family radical SAM enzyme